MLFDWDAEGWQSFVSDPEVPPIMQEAGHKGPPAGGGARRQLRRLTGQTIDATEESSWKHQHALNRPVRVGVIAEQTGPLSFMGIADANVAKMVVDDINAAGGLLGRQIELHLEDGETDDEAAEACAAKLVQEDQVDVIFGGIFSSTRQAIKGGRRRRGQDALHLPRAVRGAGVATR